MDIYKDNSIILAPLSGYTDIPFRNSARRHGCIYAFTEMIDAGALVYAADKTRHMLERGINEKWLGVQLISADPDLIKKAVVALNAFDFDLIDFNLGCPVKKVIKKGEGAALGKKADKAAEALGIIASLSKIPVSAKIRILDDSDPEPTIYLARKLQEAGAQSLTVHGRILNKMYSGTVSYDIIAQVKSAIKINVVVNGGINCLTAYEKARTESGCDSAMLATGAMGNPWLFRELSSSGRAGLPSVPELADEIKMHSSEIISRYGMEHGLRISRKIIIDYISSRGYGGELKNSACGISTMEALENIIDSVRQGPSPRYWKWLEANQIAPRRLTPDMRSDIDSPGMASK